MTPISTLAVALGAVAVVLAVVALLLARSRGKLARDAKKVVASAQAAEARTRAAEARAGAAEVREREFREELDHLVSRRLPALALHLISSHHPVPGPLYKNLTVGSVGMTGEDDAHPFTPVLDHVFATVLDSVAELPAAVCGCSA